MGWIALWHSIILFSLTVDVEDPLDAFATVLDVIDPHYPPSTRSLGAIMVEGATPTCEVDAF